MPAAVTLVPLPVSRNALFRRFEEFLRAEVQCLGQLGDLPWLDSQPDKNKGKRV